MGRLVLIAALCGVGFMVANGGLPEFQGHEDKLFFVALLPGVYILGLALLRD